MRVCLAPCGVRLFVIAAFVAGACGGGHSSSPDASPDAPLLPGPTLSARPGQNQAHVTWTAVDGATSYNVYRSNAKGTQGAMLQTVSATQLDDTSVTNFQPEWYEVTGVIGGVETQPSNQANAFGYDLSHWTTRREAYRMEAFAYAQSNQTASGLPIYVAVGYNGTVLTSNDGATWTSNTQLPISRLDSITFGNGMFVAGGYTQGGVSRNIFTSADGVNWTTQDSTDPYDKSGIAYAFSGVLGSYTSIFVTTGGTGSLLSSPDGVTWTKRTCGTVTNDFETVVSLQHPAMFSESYVMFAGGANAICYSTDGITWTQLALTGKAATSEYISAVVDDTTSSVWLLDYEGFVYQVPYNFSTHAVGTTASTQLPSISGEYASISQSVDAAMARHIVVLHNSGALFATTAAAPSGLVSVPNTTTLLAASPYTGMGSTGSSVFMLTQDEQLLRTDDGGATLSIVRDDPGGNNLSVVSRDGLTVIDKGYGAILTSTDNTAFPPSTTGAGTALGGSFPVVETATGATLIYVDEATSALQIFESADGQVWSEANESLTLAPGYTPYAGGGAVLPLDADGYLVAMTEANATATLGFGAKGSAATSFTSAPETPNIPFLKLWASGGMYYGLSNVAQAMAPPEIMESADGFTWTTIAMFPAGFDPSAYFDDGGTKYVADSYGKVSTSTDGTTWTTPAALDPSGRTVTSILRMGDHLIACGSYGLLVASLDGIHWTPIASQVNNSFTGMALTDRGLAVIGYDDVVLTAP